MLSFIGAFLLVYLLSFALGGIPFVLIIIFVEMSGNADYMMQDLAHLPNN